MNGSYEQETAARVIYSPQTVPEPQETKWDIQLPTFHARYIWGYHLLSCGEKHIITSCNGCEIQQFVKYRWTLPRLKNVWTSQVQPSLMYSYSGDHIYAGLKRVCLCRIQIDSWTVFLTWEKVLPLGTDIALQLLLLHSNQHHIVVKFRAKLKWSWTMNSTVVSYLLAPSLTS